MQMANDKIQLFEDQPVRTAWVKDEEEWYLSIVDVVGILAESKDSTSYWRKLKQRLKEEGNETVTNCHALKMTDQDGKIKMDELLIDPARRYVTVDGKAVNLAPKEYDI